MNSVVRFEFKFDFDPVREYTWSNYLQLRHSLIQRYVNYLPSFESQVISFEVSEGRNVRHMIIIK